MNFLSRSKLSRVDRLVLVAVLTYAILGSVLTLIMQTPDRSQDFLVPIQVVGAAMVLSVLAALWYGSRHGSISVGRYGFSHGRGMWANVGLVLLCTAVVARQLPPTNLSFAWSTFWAILGAFTEEVVFRVYLIRVLSILVSPKKGCVNWAVLLSSIFFTLLHLFRAPASLLLGIFLSSLVLGYITYFTRSLLFAAYYHVLSNTGPEVGFLGGFGLIGAYLVMLLCLAFRRGHSMNSSKSGQH